VFAPKLTCKSKQCIIRIPIQQFVHIEKNSEMAKTQNMEAMHKNSTQQVFHAEKKTVWQRL
jgi:hypothetical protein